MQNFLGNPMVILVLLDGGPGLDGLNMTQPCLKLVCSIFFCISCSACDTLFNSLMDLEHHKEALGHWSDDEDEDEDDDEDESDVDYDYYFGRFQFLILFYLVPG